MSDNGGASARASYLPHFSWSTRERDVAIRLPKQLSREWPEILMHSSGDSRCKGGDDASEGTEEKKELLHG